MMNKIGKKLGYKDGGFTIIEVMIVLAVAGLIMAIVLVAIPQLQRSQRNSARRDIMGRVKTEIDSYSGNNNGRIPLNQTQINDVQSRYLAGINLEDPSTGVNMPLVVPVTVAIAGSIPASTVGTINYQPSASCNGEQLVSGSARNYAMWTQLEGGSVYCLDNR